MTEAVDARLVDRTIEALRDAPAEIVCAYIHGSLARGSFTGKSDVDIAVLFDTLPADPYARSGLLLASECERALAREVDVVVLNDADPDLVHRVLRDGIIALDRDPQARIRFEVRTRAIWLDMQRYRDEYRRMPGRAHHG